MQSSLSLELDRIIRDVAATEIVARFRNLQAEDVIGKPTADDPTDIVTLADRQAERALSALLPSLVPGSVVLGEEAASADPDVLKLLRGDAPVWVVDPVDGTRNFAAGHGPFGTMVALVEGGELTLAGIYLPLTEQMFIAQRGAGAFLNGQSLRSDARAQGSRLAGTAYTKFMPAEVAAPIERAQSELGHELIPHVTCAAHEYTEVAQGRKDYVVYRRLLPWDHAPGALIAREAGGVVRHPDGREYSVLDLEGPLLIAPSFESWERSRAELFAHV